MALREVLRPIYNSEFNRLIKKFESANLHHLNNQDKPLTLTLITFNFWNIQALKVTKVHILKSYISNLKSK